MNNENTPTQIIEVRSTNNESVVYSFEHTEDSSVNFITHAYNKFCNAFKIDTANARERYYVVKG